MGLIVVKDAVTATDVTLDHGERVKGNLDTCILLPLNLSHCLTLSDLHKKPENSE